MTTVQSNTTIVTEHRTYVVDSISRKGLNRSIVSARSTDISQNTITATRTQPAIVDGFKQFIKIDSKFPVLAEFVSTGIHVPAVGNTNKPVYKTGIIYAEDVYMGDMLNIALHDPDLHAPDVKVTVFNTVTGETEHVLLVRTRADLTMYSGSIRIVPSKIKGPDFNGTMEASPDHTLRIIYEDGRGGNNKPERVIQDVRVLSRMLPPNLYTRNYITYGGTVDVVIENPLPGAVLTAVYNDQIQTLATPSGELFASRFTLLENVDVGNTIDLIYTFEDEFSEHVLLQDTIEVVDSHPPAFLYTPEVLTPETKTVRVHDSFLDKSHINVVLVFNGGHAILQLTSLGNSGVYTAELDPTRNYGDVLLVRYVSNRNGQLTVHENPVTILSTTPPPVEIPEETSPVPTVGNVSMVINGLFTLNGSFAGYIRLTPLEDDEVKCTIVRAN